MEENAAMSHRVRLDGKFFRLDGAKFYPKGVTYGPFRPNAAGEFLPEPGQTRADLMQVRELGSNLLRIYHVPPRWFLGLAEELGIKLLVDIPWSNHL